MANPWKEAAESMLQAGMSGVGSTNPSFYPSKEQVDQYNYGQASWDAQKWNRPSFQELGNTDKGPWLYSDSKDYINPNVAERQYGLNAYPGAASNWANIYNQGFDNYRFDSPKDMRDTMNWARAKDLLYSTKPSWEEYGMYDTLDSPSIMDELYGASEVSEDFIDQVFRSKYEDINDLMVATAGEGNALNDAWSMKNYGRENPFLIEDDGGWTVRDPMEIAYRYGLNLGDQYRYSPDRQPGIDEFNDPLQYLPSDRQPGISDINDPLQYLPSDRQPGLNDYLPGSPPPGAVDVTPSDLREGLTYPEGIGLDRAPEEILAASEDESSGWGWRDLLPKGLAGKALDIFLQNDIYQDPIMNVAAGDIPTQPMSEFDMSEADSYSPQNLIQLYREALDAGNEDEAEMYLNDLQLRYPTLV